MVIPLRDDNPTSRFPILTVLLIAANIFIFAFVQPHGTQAEALFTYEHAAIPCELDQGKPAVARARHAAQRRCDRHFSA